eukprot:8027232-Prorocentrum_lima.AAC.1
MLKLWAGLFRHCLALCPLVGHRLPGGYKSGEELEVPSPGDALALDFLFQESSLRSVLRRWAPPPPVNYGSNGWVKVLPTPGLHLSHLCDKFFQTKAALSGHLQTEPGSSGTFSIAVPPVSSGGYWPQSSPLILLAFSQALQGEDLPGPPPGRLRCPSSPPFPPPLLSFLCRVAWAALQPPQQRWLSARGWVVVCLSRPLLPLSQFPPSLLSTHERGGLSGSPAGQPTPTVG